MRTNGPRALAAGFLLSAFSNSASAGLIESSDAIWAGILDFSTRCGTSCAGDAYEVVELRYFDFLGEHGFSYAHQSGGASAFTSVFGYGVEFSTNEYYELLLTVTQSVFASTVVGSHPNAYSDAYSHFHTFSWGFDLNQSALFTGKVTQNGLTTAFAQSGTTYGPGLTELLLHAHGDIGTPRFLAGQSGGESSVSFVRMRLDAVAVPAPAPLALLGLGWTAVVLTRRTRR